MWVRLAPHGATDKHDIKWRRGGPIIHLVLNRAPVVLVFLGHQKKIGGEDSIYLKIWFLFIALSVIWVAWQLSEWFSRDYCHSLKGSENCRKHFTSEGVQILWTHENGKLEGRSVLLLAKTKPSSSCTWRHICLEGFMYSKFFLSICIVSLLLVSTVLLPIQLYQYKSSNWLKYQIL